MEKSESKGEKSIWSRTSLQHAASELQDQTVKEKEIRMQRKRPSEKKRLLRNPVYSGYECWEKILYLQIITLRLFRMPFL